MTSSKSKFSRIDFVLVGISPVEDGLPAVLHRYVERPQLVGKPYLELIPNTELLLVEIPLRSSPGPEVSCFVNELPTSGFDWEFSAPEKLCSVALNDVLDEIAEGDMRIVLTNQLGSLSISLTRDQIMRFKKQSVARNVARKKWFRECSTVEQNIAGSGKNFALK